MIRIIFLLGVAFFLSSVFSVPLDNGSSEDVYNFRIDAPDNDTEAGFEKWLTTVYEPQAEAIMNKDVKAQWNHDTNMTIENQNLAKNASAATAAFSKEVAVQVNKFNVTWRAFKESKNRRLYTKMSKLGDARLEADDFAKLTDLKASMADTYSKAKVCSDSSIALKDCPTDKLWSLDPEITKEMQTGRNEPLLLHLWKSWRDVSGKQYRDKYLQYVELKNKAAKLNDYEDNGEQWRAPYVEPDYVNPAGQVGYSDTEFMADIDRIWNQLKPLYEQVHAYVRGKLIDQYPKVGIQKNGPIPAHLTGNMWAQQWSSLLDFTQLYPKLPSLDVTAKMVEQKWDADKMFKTSEKFFTDLNLLPMNPGFYNDSMLTKPAGREVVCHASAWDFYDKKDFRIKQCTVVTMDDLITVHHEMGHVEYFIQYKDQPVPFREGANDGFHEAIGDVLALSVNTPKHLELLGLLDKSGNVNQTQQNLNFMFSTALDKIAFLPFGLLMDKYRYDIFQGKIGATNLNAGWWNYRKEMQGICPPVERSEADFDAGAKFHIPNDVPYMRYFVSFVIQFQFHKALCAAASQTGPLYTCDINESKAAGELLGNALNLGSSQPWQVAMKAITGQDKMDAGPLVEFFEPLIQELKRENTRLGNPIGWVSEGPCVVPPKGAAGYTAVSVFTIFLGLITALLRFSL